MFARPVSIVVDVPNPKIPNLPPDFRQVSSTTAASSTRSGSFTLTAASRVLDDVSTQFSSMSTKGLTTNRLLRTSTQANAVVLDFKPAVGREPDRGPHNPLEPELPMLRPFEYAATRLSSEPPLFKPSPRMDVMPPKENSRPTVEFIPRFPTMDSLLPFLQQNFPLNVSLFARNGHVFKFPSTSTKASTAVVSFGSGKTTVSPKSSSIKTTKAVQTSTKTTTAAPVTMTTFPSVKAVTVNFNVTCDEGYFKCTGGICVPMYLYCNGVDNCLVSHGTKKNCRTLQKFTGCIVQSMEGDDSSE